MASKPEEGEIILYWMKRHPDCPIGARCVASRCTDEFGEGSMSEPTKEEIREAQAKKEPEPKPELLLCNSTSKPAWFMNLDSTLKDKKYNY
jgi:hypothetical protein